MTENYVNSAIEVFSEIQSRGTSQSVESLTIITSMGVGGTIIGLFTKELPSLNWTGAIYFLILVGIGYTAKKLLNLFYKRRKYDIQDVEVDTNIDWGK